jgi:hypothetical protein
MRIINVCLCLCFLFLMGCEKQSTPLPPEVEFLEGIWVESFQWIGFGDQIGDGDTFQGRTRTSTLILSDGQFVLRIQPPRRTFINEPDTVYVGWAADTLYTGSCEVRGDSILFSRVRNDRDDRFTFSIVGDHLQVGVLGEQDPSGYTALPISSFLWAFSLSKTSGVFTRLE